MIKIQKTLSIGGGKPEAAKPVISSNDILGVIAKIKFVPSDTVGTEELKDLFREWAKHACSDKEGKPNAFFTIRTGKKFGVDSDEELLQHFAVLQRYDFFVPADCTEQDVVKAYDSCRIKSEGKIFRGNDSGYHMTKDNGSVVTVKKMVLYKVMAYSCNYGGESFTQEVISDNFKEALNYYVSLKRNAGHNWRMF